MDQYLEAAIRKVGSLAKFAKAAGKNHSTVLQWRRIPAEQVPALSEKLGIPRHEMRPDLWEPPASSEAA